MTEAPGPDVLALAERRAGARSRGDFATADAVRQQLAEAGWTVIDEPGGAWRLEPAVTPESPARALRAADVVSVLGDPAADDVSVHWVVEGWADDVRRAIASFRAHEAAGRSGTWSPT